MEKISEDAWKVTLLPVSKLSISFTRKSGATGTPFSKRIFHSALSLQIVNSNHEDNAFTTETPTPCKPPETL